MSACGSASGGGLSKTTTSCFDSLEVFTKSDYGGGYWCAYYTYNESCSDTSDTVSYHWSGSMDESSSSISNSVASKTNNTSSWSHYTESSSSSGGGSSCSDGDSCAYSPPQSSQTLSYPGWGGWASTSWYATRWSQFSFSGGNGGYCFTEGTQIVVDAEFDANDVFVQYVTVNIEDIKVSDLVYSYDTITGEVSQQEVTDVIVREWLTCEDPSQPCTSGSIRR